MMKYLLSTVSILCLLNTFVGAPFTGSYNDIDFNEDVVRKVNLDPQNI